MCPSGFIGKSHKGAVRPAALDCGDTVAHHHPDLRARRVETRDPALGFVGRRRRIFVVFVGGVFAELDEHQTALGVVADTDEPRPEERLVFTDDGASHLHRARRFLGLLFRDAVEELAGLDGQQTDLFLLDEHRQHGCALAGLDHEGALARTTERARGDVVDGIELDEIGHEDAFSDV